MTACSKQNRRRVAIAALFAVCGFAVWTPPNATWAGSMRREPLFLTTQTGRTEISAEIAVTGPEQEQGLMFRTSMADTDGMLFVYDTAKDLSMWMHNTYVPLDMVFIRADGRVARIETNAEPLSDRVIESGSAVAAVLELKAGTAQRLSLKPGDKVESASLRSTTP